MIQPLSPIDAISPAFQRTSEMLLARFRVSQWLKIGFIGWLAGGAGYESLNLNTGSPRLPPGMRRGGVDPFKDLEKAIVTLQDWMLAHLFAIGVIVAFLMVVSLLFAYLNCRFRFIMMDAVLTADPNIERGWREYATQANSFFLFWVVLMLASWTGLYFAVILPLWRVFKSGALSQGAPLEVLFTIIGGAVLKIVLFGLVFAIITTLANDFVVPILAVTNCSIADAFVRLKDMIAAETGSFAGYLGMKFLLHIAAGILIGVLFLIGFLVLLVPCIILSVVGAFIVAALKSAGIGGVILGAVLVGLFVLIVVALVFLLALMSIAPRAVFFTAYALYFMGRRLPGLRTRLWPEPPAVVAPPMSGPLPPPAPA